MLNGLLIHPEILLALGRCGHGSKVLITDGNFPHSTAAGPNAQLVYLNLSPGLLSCTDVLRVLRDAIPIEAATIMDTNKTGPYVLPTDPDIWAEFSELLTPTECAGKLDRLERFAFYDAAKSPDVALTIATGERRIYANLLLTIGVVR